MAQSQKAILLRTLIIYGRNIQLGSVVDIRLMTNTYAIIIADRLVLTVPRHNIAIVPPDSPRVHKHKKKSNKRKKTK